VGQFFRRREEDLSFSSKDSLCKREGLREIGGICLQSASKKVKTQQTGVIDNDEGSFQSRLGGPRIHETPFGSPLTLTDKQEESKERGPHERQDVSLHLSTSEPINKREGNANRTVSFLGATSPERSVLPMSITNSPILQHGSISPVWDPDNEPITLRCIIYKI
jgi:hypothetical protein